MRHGRRPVRVQVYAAVLVCTAEQWENVRGHAGSVRPGITRGREFLARHYQSRRVVFVRAGEDAVEAASSAQLAIDLWDPRVLIVTAGPDGAEEAVRHIARISGLPALPESLATGSLDESLPAALAAAEESLRLPVPASVPNPVIPGTDGSAE